MVLQASLVATFGAVRAAKPNVKPKAFPSRISRSNVPAILSVTWKSMGGLFGGLTPKVFCGVICGCTCGPVYAAILAVILSGRREPGRDGLHEAGSLIYCPL